MSRSLIGIGVVCVGVSACTIGPVAPTPPPTQLIALSGQSNAVLVASDLTAAYDQVVWAGQSATSITAWADGAPQWLALAPLLHQPLRAFIWWQGESDEGDLPAYRLALEAFLAHVRAEAQQPGLPILICGATAYDVPGQAGLRDLQRTVARELGLTFVPSDDLPFIGWHLTEEGYALMADRIVKALP